MSRCTRTTLRTGSNRSGSLTEAKTAHDLLHEKSDRESDTGNRLLATASRLDETALGRRVLVENGLEGETMARFIAAGKKSTRHRMWPCQSGPVTGKRQGRC
ncbi:conjugative transfer relaxase/helicase TraI domain-containing protein [Escherichia coli]|uniref:conjugative transfer relaxase/helicase TraI domain-containing protein n=1 Tax=Escherichia coli TaxID=562 RepID=UPI002020FDC2|nr:conjugative transfer relaxase/helicase TraI domain-containing protein [Escherichia coli]